ncbi:MAG: YlbF family regulator [Clostridiales bacterium]|nr:YlbF family regulator [Clostridiales bacterium]
MDKVFQKTRELGQALLECEVYANMKEAEERAMKNQEAAQLMASFLEKRTQIQQMMQEGNPDPGAMKRLSDEMDADQERLQMMDDIVALTQARGEFTGLINQVNQVLQFIVTGRMDDPDGGCSGSCETCGRCH